MLMLHLSTFNNLLNANLMPKFSLFSQIGEESMKSSTPFSNPKEFPTMCLVPMLTNKMALLNESIATLWKLV
jgi:hypothetical protein